MNWWVPHSGYKAARRGFFFSPEKINRLIRWLSSTGFWAMRRKQRPPRASSASACARVPRALVRASSASAYARAMQPCACVLTHECEHRTPCCSLSYLTSCGFCFSFLKCLKNLWIICHIFLWCLESIEIICKFFERFNIVLCYIPRLHHSVQ